MVPLGLTLGHLLMDDTAAGSHPLDITGTDDPFVPHTVAMLHQPFKDVGDGLDPPVRMPGKTGKILFRI